MAGAIVGRLSSWMQGEPFSLPKTLPLMVVAALLVVLLHFLQPTLAGADGVKAITAWGTRGFVAWGDIERVAFGRLYLLQPSLKLTDRRGRAYWIATDTKDLGALHALACRYGGADHPLAKALETPLHAL